MRVLEVEPPVAVQTPTREKEPKPSLFQTIMSVWYLHLVVVVSLVGRFITMPWYIDSRDGVFFTRALERYAVAEMRPHFPGYPVYIWAGEFFQMFIPDPVKALHALSIVATCLTIYPLAGIAGEWRKNLGGDVLAVQLARFTAAGLWALVPLSLVGGSEIFSDPLAILLSLTALWFCQKALAPTKNAGGWLIIAAFLAGLMVGVRLSYLVLILPLVLVAWQKRKEFLGNRKLFNVALLALVSLGLAGSLWLGWQFLQEGTKFYTAGIKHLDGHYSSWGGSITTDKNLVTRPVRWLETGVVYGIGGWWMNTPLERIPVSFLFSFLVGVGSFRLVRYRQNRVPLILASLWAVPYILWLGLGNDIDLARYSLPLVVLACIVAGLGLPKKLNLAIPVLAITLVCLAVVSVPLTLEHATNAPIGERMASYVKYNLDPSETTLFISDETATLIFFAQQSAPNFQTVRLLNKTRDAQIQQYSNRALYGTWLPDNAPEGWHAVVRLCRGKYMESRGVLEVWLYYYDPSRPVDKSQTIACF
jgi:Protein of unknown function (DUF2723)